MPTFGYGKLLTRIRDPPVMPTTDLSRQVTLPQYGHCGQPVARRFLGNESGIAARVSGIWCPEVPAALFSASSTEGNRWLSILRSAREQLFSKKDWNCGIRKHTNAQGHPALIPGWTKDSKRLFRRVEPGLFFTSDRARL